jgi:DNA-binding transcriptional ArsR family regulator
MTTLVPEGPADLLAVRFAWSPIWETLHAVRTFVDPRHRPYHAAWHALVADAAAGIDLVLLFAVNPRQGFTPDFLTPPPKVPNPSFRDQLDEVRATSADQIAVELRRCRDGLTDPGAREEVDRMLADPAAARDLLAERTRDVWERIVAPFWARVRRLLDADIAQQSRELSRRGLGPMIDGIDSRIHWHDQSVVVDDGSEARVSLGGRGLVLTPSAYVWPSVVAIVDKPWQPTIVYPARGIADLWQQPPTPPHALVRLIGRTRALLLTSLDQPTSTSTLAAILGYSVSGTSEHVIALRDAGLVSGTRHGHEIRYVRTSLGTKLVQARREP